MKFYKTVVTLTVLSEYRDVQDFSLEDISHAITEGDCSGDLAIESVTELSAKQAADALIEQGSDPGFFNLDENGNKIEI